MKIFLCVVLCGLMAACCAEPPRFRSNKLKSRVLSRQEVAPASGSYPPSDWKPDGETLELLTEQTEAPIAEYGPPALEYGPAVSADEIAVDEPAVDEFSVNEPLADELAADEPVAYTDENPAAETVAVDQNGRLRSAPYVIIPVSSLQRNWFAPQRVAPAKLRRDRFF